MIEKTFSLLVCLLIASMVAGCASSTGGQASEIDKIETVSSDSGSSGVLVATLDSGTTMRVLWTVSDYKIGEGAAWGEEEAKALLFKPLDMNDTEITFDSQVCKGVTFQQEQANAAEYLSSVWKITPQTLGFEDQELQVFKTNCTLPGFQEYIRLSDGRLIVPINGVFFFFKPAVIK
jgi:hypothetical protein